ncbi:MAG: ABC transporter permease subunit [Caulobacteraceae bacterium]|nr:ABC transporter permease subunit [Caulobacteraceae bacterium]
MLNASPSVWAQRLFMVLVALFIAAPLVVVAGISFSGSDRMSFPPARLSLGWYRAFFTDPDWMASLRASLTISVSAAALSVAAALPIAYAAWRYGSKASKALAGLGAGLFLLPGVVVAVMFSAFWAVLGHIGRIENVAISHAAVFLGVPLTLLAVGFESIDRQLLEAARTMGARESDGFRMVIRPTIAPYVICALAYVFVLSLNEYLIAYMVAGFSVQTLPIRIFTNMRSGYDPSMCVAAVLFMTAGFCIFGLLALVGDLPRLMGRTQPLRD